MRIISISIFALLLSSASCKKDSIKSVKTIKGFYNYMHFERTGGGQKDFNLYATNDSNKLMAIISKYNFRDTTIQIIIDKSAENATFFSDFNKALNNIMPLNGDFTQSTLPTGTWSYIYFVSNNNQTEVSNIDLRNSLLHFEQIVEGKVK